MAQPTGTVTLLFTDIEGSTRLLGRLGTERYGKTLDLHRRLLREAFDRHRGYEVHYEGDSFFVAFSDASEAVAAAVEAQHALGSYCWAEGEAIRVRMGVHTGEPLAVPPKYVGLDVHRAARIMAAAHGGQLLISARTRRLVSDGRDAAPTLRDLGAFELRDLPEPERLFQVVIGGLPDTFPPVRIYQGVPASAGLPDYSLPPADIACPYKGLAAFQREDSHLFFGRTELVAELVHRMAEASFIAVVGPSGSGKSSLVRAGLLPALEAEAGPVAAIVLTPGPEPLRSLADGISAVAGATAASFVASPASVARMLATTLATAVRPLVLVIDQFEEVFALCDDEEERRLFLDVLLAAPARGVPVVLALRADFYGHCVVYPSLAALIEQHQALIGPMSAEELRAAVERPASDAGLVLEPGLVEGILNDVVGEPGALPLLSHSLVETWKRRSGPTLTLLGYLQAGGVRGALAKSAEAVFGALAPEQQRLVRSVLLRLVNVGEEAEYTRRRSTMDELVPRQEHAAAMEQLVQVLVEARLVSVGEGRSVEMAHEALIRHWPRLQEWLSEDREGRVVHARLADAAREWQATQGDSGALYRGGRLVSASDWAAQHDDELNDAERAFLGASRAAERAELEAARRRNRRLRALAAGLALMLAGAIVAAVIALQQRARAQEGARSALSQAVASEAEGLFPRQGDLGLLLALEAYRTARTETARTTLLRMIHRMGTVRAILRGYSGVVTSVALGADGGTIVSGGEDGRVLLWEVGRARPTAVPIADRSVPVASVALSRNGRVVAWGTDGGEVEAWDRESGKQLATFAANGAAVDSISLSPDGSLLASGSAFGGTARLWDLRRRRPAGPEVAVASDYRSVFGFSSEGSLVAVPDTHRRVGVWNLRTGQLLTRFAPRRRSEITAAAISPDGTLVAAGDTSGHLDIWTIRPARSGVELRATKGAISGLKFSGNGKRLISGSMDGSVAVWDIRQRRLAAPLLRSFAGAVQAVALAQGGDAIAAGTSSGAVVLWQSFSGESVVAPVGPSRETTALAIEPAGSRFASGDSAGHISFWSLSRKRPSTTISTGTGVSTLAFSPTGRVLASGGSDGRVRFFDVHSHRQHGIGFSPSLFPASDPVKDLAYDAAGTVLAAASQNGFVATWNVGAQHITALRPSGLPEIWHLAFARNGRQLIVASDLASRVLIWDTTRMRPAFALHTQQPVGPIAFSPTADLLAVGSYTGSVTLWRIGRGTATRIGTPFVSPGGAVWSLAFNRSGTTLASGSRRGIVSIYDLTGAAKLVARVDALDDTVTQLAFTPDDHWLIAAGAPGIVRLNAVLWTADAGALESHVCALVERNLTSAEWRAYFPGRSYRRSCPQSSVGTG